MTDDKEGKGSALDRELPEGHDPDEEVGPEGCLADSHQVGFGPGELDGDGGPADVQVIEQLQEAFAPEPEILGISAEDGLPMPMGEGGSNLQTAPAFTIESFVCLEDASSYVEVLGTDALFAHPALQRLAEGSYHRDPSRGTPGWSFAKVFAARPEGVLVRHLHDELGEDVAPWTFEPSEVVRAFGLTFGKLGSARRTVLAQVAARHRAQEAGTRGVLAPPKGLAECAPYDALAAHLGTEAAVWVLVQPKRERCSYYKRQVFNQDGTQVGEPGHYLLFPYCTALRSVGGAHLSLRDQALYGCDFRSPEDPASRALHLDGPENKRLESAKHRVNLPLFRGADGPVLEPLSLPGEVAAE